MSDLPNEVSVDQQASVAGRVTAPNNPVTGLYDECRRVIDALEIPASDRSMALTKLAEMIYWMRAGQKRDSV